MPDEITIPSPGESITEVMLGPWHKQAGEWVEKDETLVEIESDKVTLEVPAPESGVLTVVAETGAEMQVGQAPCLGDIDELTGTVIEVEGVVVASRSRCE